MNALFAAGNYFGRDLRGLLLTMGKRLEGQKGEQSGVHIAPLLRSTRI
jgi:hypothetical protein